MTAYAFVTVPNDPVTERVYAEFTLWWAFTAVDHPLSEPRYMWFVHFVECLVR